MPDPTFVTILRTGNAQLVRMIVPILQEEGIAVQHPGLEHASLLPGLNYVEIDLRVPSEHAEFARELVASLQTPVPEDAARAPLLQPATPYRGGGQEVAFRDTSDRAKSMAALGLAVAVVIVMGLRLLGAEPAIAPVALVLITGPVMGHLVGRSLHTVRCSLPGCANQLDEGARACPHCGASLVADLRPGQDHAAAIDAYRSQHDLPAAITADEG